jgi:hypothetical protein
MRFLRMLIGYLLACFGAAMALGLFAFAPNSIDAFFDKLPEVLDNAWGISPYLTGAIALLGAVPAVLAFQYAESNGIRSWVYYELVGAAVAIAAYWLAHGTESVPLRSEGNIYSTIAFGVAGAVLGLLYWLFSGRYAGMDGTATAARPGTGVRPQTAMGKPPGPAAAKKPATA